MYFAMCLGWASSQVARRMRSGGGRERGGLEKGFERVEVVGGGVKM
jgi:hypothetical protein